MANALFDAARESFLLGEISWIDDTIRAVLVDHAIDSPLLALDAFLADIDPDARVATSEPFTGKTAVSGVADADDITFEAVQGPRRARSVLIYQDTGDDQTSRLIAMIDTLGIGDFPIVPNGGDIMLRWDNGINRIFKL
jgi:hypothetical protein